MPRLALRAASQPRANAAFFPQEIGITGGEEDGVNNESVDNNSLYTQPEDIYEIYKTLEPISPYLSLIHISEPTRPY